MKKLSIALISLLMILSLAACSGGSSDEPSSSSTTETGYQETFTYGVGGEPEYLDPAVASDSVSSYILNQVYYPLFSIGEDGSTVPEAVTSYEISEDGLVYTLHLTEDNYWSDGVACTAHDYIYGMKRSLGYGVADSYYSYFIRNFVLNAYKYGADGNTSTVAEMTDLGIVALDDYTIEITLAAPCDYFLSLMTANTFYPVREDVAPELDYTWAAELHPTNGAYTYTSINNAVEIAMTKNEYFARADEVTTQNLRAVIMPDPDAQLMAFQTGEIDFATNIDASSAYAVYGDSDELVLSDAVINYYIQFSCYSDANEGYEALQDVRVRRAIALGIDRSNIVTALDAGDMYYELYGFVPVGFQGVNGDFRLEQDEENPLVYTDKDEARSLMEAAGYSEDNRLSLTYVTNQAAMHDTVSQVIAAELAEIYIDVTIENQEIRVFFDNRSNGLTQIARGAMSADYMDVTTYLDMAASGNQDVLTWGDATYDEMLATAATMTGTERIEYLHEAEAYLVGEMAYTAPLFGYRNIALAKSGTTGYTSSPQGNHNFSYVKVPA